MLGHSSTWVTERYARLLPSAQAQAAAETFHEPSTGFSAEVAQVVDFIQHAMGDSNPRPLAPEANALSS
jgi:hypothetical protein